MVLDAPPPCDYVVVAHRRGHGALRRRLGDGWTTDDLGPGDVSLLTRATEAQCFWSPNVETVQVPLSRAGLTRTGQEMYEREIAGIELCDVVKADDPVIHHTALLIDAETAGAAAGSRIVVDALLRQLSVQVLRHHARVQFREPDGGLTHGQEHAVRAYVEEHLGERVSLHDLALIAGLSRHHFTRRFRQSTGTTPHEFLLRQRVERAKALLRGTDAPLLEIACTCGFADQSHMTREFRKRVGRTPGRFRTRPG
jgi:AraC family transcriptional regulator